MAETSFHYDQTSGQILTVSWQGFWQDIQVKIGETLVGKVYRAEELLRGVEFGAPGGGKARVAFAVGLDGFGLRAWRDGERLPRTRQAAMRSARLAVWALYFVAAQSIFLGIISLGVTFVPRLSFGPERLWPLLLSMAALYFVMAGGVQRGSLRALYAALVLYLLESAVNVGLGFALDAPPSLISLAGRAVVFLFLLSALEPLGGLKGTR